WLTPTQPDGSSTALVLNPDRTCRLRWLDAGGGEAPNTPPQEGRWRVEGGTLVVDTRRTTGLEFSGGDLRRRRSGHTWSFAVVEGGLIHGRESPKPVTLRRAR